MKWLTENGRYRWTFTIPTFSPAALTASATSLQISETEPMATMTRSRQAPVVVEEVICPSRNGADLIHIALHDIGKRVIKQVGCFAVLEVDIGIFRRAADDGSVRIQRTGAECGESFLVDERFQFVVLHDFHFCISWLVRNPSKKLMKGTRPLMAARWAMPARSMISCTFDSASMAQPVALAPLRPDGLRK